MFVNKVLIGARAALGNMSVLASEFVPHNEYATHHTTHDVSHRPMRPTYHEPVHHETVYHHPTNAGTPAKTTHTTEDPNLFDHGLKWEHERAKMIQLADYHQAALAHEATIVPPHHHTHATHHESMFGDVVYRDHQLDLDA